MTEIKLWSEEVLLLAHSMVSGPTPIKAVLSKNKSLLIPFKIINSFLSFSDVFGGPHERRLLNDLMEHYNTLERPVYNESEPLALTFGLTLQQIIDVVSMH